MVGVFTFGALERRMNNLGLSLTKGLTKVTQNVATGIGATVVDTTRVDTGLARSNWRATIAAPASGVIPPYAPGIKLGIGEGANASAAKAQQKQAIERFDARKPVSIFITNNVSYIGVLNNGSSVQAPGNMVQLGIQTGRDILRISVTKILDRL